MEVYLDRFAEIVRRQPDAPAAADPNRELSFREFDRASDRLAQRMCDERIGPNDLYGFLGAPGVERLVVLFAAVKAGAAMINLDPESPAAALRDLIETCDVARLIAERPFAAQARALHPVEPMQIGAELFDGPAPAPTRVRGCDDEALVGVLYTSGSTGRPKCVPLTRGGLDRRMTRKFERLYPPRPGRRRANLVTHFRLLPELYSPQNGEALDCFDLRRHGMLAFADWLRERRITTYTSQVSVFRQLMATTRAPFPDIDLVMLVGEQVIRSDLEAFNASFPPGAELGVRFGSTEHCDVAVYRYRRGDPIPGDTLPLGPIAYPETIRLVDAAGADAAPGQPGEILVTGDFMATRYIEDPERSAATFSPVPGKDGFWRCRTGFFAYLDADGMLHPLGRKDEQIKIRGYNVRPPEVEQMVQAHPGVQRAAVVPFEGARRIQRLACFFTSASAPPPDAAALRAFLAPEAPDFMIPSLFLPIPEMPMTASGKIAKRELPDPLSLLAATEPPCADAETWVEGAPPSLRTLRTIWADLLGHGGFGVDDDFFDIGGDSLQAMAMIAEIEARFDLRLPLEGLILDGASIRAIAARIDRLGAGRVVAFRRGGSLPPMFAAHVLGGHLSDYLALAHALGPDQPFFGLHPKGLNRSEAPARAMADMAADACEALRSAQPAGPYRLIGYSYGGIVAFEMARRLLAEGAAVDRLILLDTGVAWASPIRYAKAIYRPLKTGDVASAWRRAVREVPAALGLGAAAPDSLDGAHRTAMLAYRPAPLALPAALLVSARQNPDRIAIRREWGRLIGDGLTTVAVDAAHAGLAREPAAWTTAQIVRSWLARARTSATVVV